MGKVFQTFICLLFAKLLAVRAQLNLYIAKNDVNSYLKLNFNFDLYLITNDEPVTLLKDYRGFYDFMSPLQSSVKGVKMRWYSSPHSSHYNFELMSSDQEMLSRPVASIANQGVVPHSVVSFYIPLDCTGKKAGLVDISMELNYTKIVGNSVESSSLQTFFIKIKKWCNKTDLDKNTDKAVNHWSRGAIVGLSAGITVFLCLSFGLGLLMKHHLKQRRLKMEFDDDLEVGEKRQFGLKKVTSLPIHKPAPTTSSPPPPVLYSPKRPKLRVPRPTTRQRSETNTSDTSTLELICKEESDDETPGQKSSNQTVKSAQEDGWYNSLSNISLNPEHLEIKKCIATGLSGDVYLGILKDTEKEVAIKVLQDGLSSDVYEKFMKAVLVAMTELDHPNVLRPLGVVLAPSTQILMPYMKFGSLDKVLESQQGEPLPYQLILNIGYNITKALNYLMKQNYIHKTFSSKDCMVGQDMEIVVHICHCHHDKQKKWMAPECLSSGSYSQKSLVWSLGVVLWELTAPGELPYKDVESAALLDHLKLGRRLKQSVCCTDELYSVMLRCWSTNPAERPSLDWLETWFTKCLNENSTLC